MESYGRRLAQRPFQFPIAFGLFAAASGLVFGCASPGAPRPPSLQLPRIPDDLTAVRSGSDVQLRFTVPDRTTDGLPLQGGFVHGSLCRQAAPRAACEPVALTETAVPLRITAGKGTPSVVLWTDHLPPELSSGAARPMLYRLKLGNEQGRSAGYSNPVYAAAGASPPPVAAFNAQGTRLGVLLAWTPVPGAGEVLLERQQVDPPPAANPARPGKGNPIEQRLRPQRSSTKTARAGDVWLQAEPGNTAAAYTLDGAVTEHYGYRYTAVRRVQAELGGRLLELRSAPSAPAEITWNDIYPPPSPQRLTAVGFAVPPGPKAQGPSFAVDLIWEPVRDLRVTGYLVRRTTLTAAGTDQGATMLLTPQPVPSPSFHDATAVPDQAYRYQVTAVDAKGNRSAPAQTTLAPSAP